MRAQLLSFAGLLFVAGAIFALVWPITDTGKIQSALVDATLPQSASGPVSATSSIRVPILVYHIVRPAYASDTRSVRKFAVTPGLFDEQMAYLRDNDYHVIPFSALEDHFYNGVALPERPVVITFDDGWKDQFDYALPILMNYRYVATFFVPSNYPGNRAFLTWDDMKAMITDGMTIGDHSKTHPYLTKQSTTTLIDEIAGSKHVLEQALGTTINEFAYPFGQYNDYIVRMVEAAGFKAARGDTLGVTQSRNDLYMLRGLNAPTTMADFERYFPAK